MDADERKWGLAFFDGIDKIKRMERERLAGSAVKYWGTVNAEERRSRRSAEGEPRG